MGAAGVFLEHVSSLCETKYGGRSGPKLSACLKMTICPGQDLQQGTLLSERKGHEKESASLCAGCYNSHSVHTQEALAAPGTEGGAGDAALASIPARGPYHTNDATASLPVKPLQRYSASAVGACSRETNQSVRPNPITRLSPLPRNRSRGRRVPGRNVLTCSGAAQAEAQQQPQECAHDLPGETRGIRSPGPALPGALSPRLPQKPQPGC